MKYVHVGCVCELGLNIARRADDWLKPMNGDELIVDEFACYSCRAGKFIWNLKKV